MKKYKKILGDFGEKTAADYLTEHGYYIRMQNFRSPFGEIDIIAEINGTLAFIEVKTRSSDVFGVPAAAVDRKKQTHIWKSAEVYLAENQWNGDVCFDVVEVYAFLADDGSFHTEKITHIKNIVMEV